jgi:DNA (cytosine-5)-methyltransferase 3A
MRVLSYFDGVSCGRVALERANIPVTKYVACEIEKSAITISQKNYPDIIQAGSVTDFKSAPEEFDLLIGGSPCQSFSRSGDNSGFDGKSGLFWEYVRILKETNPRYFLLENVVMSKEWENIITQALGVSPVQIDSKHFSAQKRQRLYWTNIDFDKTLPEDGESLEEVFQGIENREETDHKGLLYYDEFYKVKNATKKGFLPVENFDSVNLDFPTSKTRRGRVSKQKSNTLNTSCNQGTFFDGKIYKFNVEECERLQTLPSGYTKADGVSESQRRKAIGNGWTVDVIAHIFKGIK